MNYQQLIEILVCPKCKGKLAYQADPEGFVCNKCQLLYPVIDQIPVMIIEDALQLGEKGEASCGS